MAGQIRYNLSPLRFHLFTYNIIDNPMCPGCHDSVESIEHFFLIVCVIMIVAVFYGQICKLSFKMLVWILVP